MKNAEVMIKGIKCDNPSCSFRDDSVMYEDYPKWLNKPCPICGHNLLTEKDYKACKAMVNMAKFLNIFPSSKGKRTKMSVDLCGKGFNDCSVKVEEID